jgi:hypothetical protein
MSWGTEYADLHHSHREIDDERYDRERAISDAEGILNSRIDDARLDCNAAREELWRELSIVNELLGELTRRVGALEHGRPRPGEAFDGS